jgi:Protein of unknown function (DUF3579)
LTSRREHSLPGGQVCVQCKKIAAGWYNPLVLTSPAVSFGRIRWVFYMAEAPFTEYFIQGITKDGRKFRPSDWAERLAGVMSCYGPGAKGPNAYLQYSHYARPVLLGDLKCVILDSRLRELEPMAFDFVMNFARDNGLVVTEACELPEHHGAVQRGKA